MYNIYIYIYMDIYIHMFGFAGGAECLYDYLVVFGPQLLLNMWLPRSIGCSRGCGMSSCNHACEPLLAWICWRGFSRCGLLGVDFGLAWMFGVDLLGVDLGEDFPPTTKPPNRCGHVYEQIHPFVFTPKSAPCNHAAMWPCCSMALPLLQLSFFHSLHSHVRTIGCRAP